VIDPSIICYVVAIIYALILRGCHYIQNRSEPVDFMYKLQSASVILVCLFVAILMCLNTDTSLIKWLKHLSYSLVVFVILFVGVQRKVQANKSLKRD